MVKYLESSHVREFDNKTSDEIACEIRQNKLDDPKYDPTLKAPTCQDSHGNCKARFPCKTLDTTQVDMQTGHLKLEKGEAWYDMLRGTNLEM